MHPTSLPLLHFDANPDAVINPFRDEGYQFPQRMLFAFISAANILNSWSSTPTPSSVPLRRSPTSFTCTSSTSMGTRSDCAGLRWAHRPPPNSSSF